MQLGYCNAVWLSVFKSSVMSKENVYSANTRQGVVPISKLFLKYKILN